MPNSTIRSFAVGAVLLLGAASQVLADGPNYGRSRATLEGTWEVVITPYVCATGVSLTAAAFKSRLTFNSGGTMVETPFNPSFQPGQRTSGLGYWERTGKDSYHAVFEAFVNFTSVVTPPATPRYVRGFQRVDQGLEMQDTDHWTSSATVTFRDEAGNVIPPSGCMTATGERLQ